MKKAILVGLFLLAVICLYVYLFKPHEIPLSEAVSAARSFHGELNYNIFTDIEVEKASAFRIRGNKIYMKGSISRSIVDSELQRGAGMRFEEGSGFSGGFIERRLKWWNPDSVRPCYVLSYSGKMSPDNSPAGATIVADASDNSAARISAYIVIFYDNL